MSCSSPAASASALFPDDAADAATLLKNADTAMYRAKDQGKNTYQFYSPRGDRGDLRAPDAGDQPAAGAGARGVRAALPAYRRPAQPRAISVSRPWCAGSIPSCGMVPPYEFIPLAEETGLIIPIGHWVLEHACRALRTLHARGFTELNVAVNLSVKQFRERDLARSVALVLSGPVWRRAISRWR